MKSAIKQIIGYILMLLIVASVIWFMMYKYNEKIKAEQSYNDLINHRSVVTEVI